MSWERNWKKEVAKDFRLSYSVYVERPWRSSDDDDEDDSQQKREEADVEKEEMIKKKMKKERRRNIQLKSQFWYRMLDHLINQWFTKQILNIQTCGQDNRRWLIDWSRLAQNFDIFPKNQF